MKPFYALTSYSVKLISLLFSNQSLALTNCLSPLGLPNKMLYAILFFATSATCLAPSHIRALMAVLGAKLRRLKRESDNALPRNLEEISCSGPYALRYSGNHSQLTWFAAALMVRPCRCLLLSASRVQDSPPVALSQMPISRVTRGRWGDTR